MLSDSVDAARRLVFVTGPSGAGRSSALNVLEDACLEVVENLTMRLLRALIESGGNDQPIALGIDPRNRDFSTNGVMDALGRLNALPGVEPDLFYLDC